MSIIVWLIVGGLAGWIASMIVGTDKDQGILANIIVGIVGAVVGGTLWTLLSTGTLDFNSAISGFNLGSLLLAVIGSVILLLVLKAFNRNPKF